MLKQMVLAFQTAGQNYTSELLYLCDEEYHVVTGRAAHYDGGRRLTKKEAVSKLRAEEKEALNRFKETVKGLLQKTEALEASEEVLRFIENLNEALRKSF